MSDWITKAQEDAAAYFAFGAFCVMLLFAALALIADGIEAWGRKKAAEDLEKWRRENPRWPEDAEL
ncbi:MAG: hypothetical protein ACRD2L_25710 [Terriglobia bacterium]